MTKNSYDGFGIINIDFLVKNLIQTLTPDVIESIGQINVENMVHCFPQKRLEHIKLNFINRLKAEKKITNTFLHKHFSWSKDATTICEIIKHAVSENQFINLKNVVGDFECLLILRLHGLQISRNISLIQVEKAISFVEHLAQSDQYKYYRFNREVAEPCLHKNLEFEQVQLYETPYTGLYYFADHIEMNYSQLIRSKN